MSTVAKWVLAGLLLVTGAVFVARSVSRTGEESTAVAGSTTVPQVKSAGVTTDTKKKAAAPAADLACKKACVEVNEVANESISTAKLAPGSVTLSKLAFEVPNLNELENEINARKSAEARAAAAIDIAKTEASKTAADISAAAQSGIDLLETDLGATNLSIADLDAALQTKLNKEIADRAAAINITDAKFNQAVADRKAELIALMGDLANASAPVGTPILQVNEPEIVALAISTRTLDNSAVTSAKIANGTVVGEALDLTVPVVGDIALETVTGEGDNLVAGPSGNLALSTVGLRNLVNDAVDTTKIAPGSVETGDVSTSEATNLVGDNIRRETVTGEADNDSAVVDGNLALLTVGTPNLADDAVTSAKIDDATVQFVDVVGTEFASQVEYGDLASATLASTDDPSDADGLVSWFNLKDVPGGIATGLATDLACSAPAGCVDTADIKDSNVTDVKIVTVSGTKLTGVVTATDLACTAPAGCVDTADIKDSNVTDVKILSLSGTKLTGAVTATALACTTACVETAEITDLNVTTAKLAGADASVADQILVGQTRAVTAGKLSDGAVIGRTIGEGAVSADKLLANAASGAVPGPAAVPVASTPVATSPVLTLAGTGDHKILVTATALVRCTAACTATPSTIGADVFMIGVAPVVAPTSVFALTPATTVLDQDTEQTTIAFTTVVTVTAGTHTFDLRLSKTGASPVEFANATITAVDLGKG